MRYSLALILTLTGCSLAVNPNPRLLDSDAGPSMGDANPMLPDGGTDGGPSGTCVAAGTVLPVVHNDCGFYATEFRVGMIDCPRHGVSGQLTVHCMQTVRNVPVTYEPLPIDCDGGTFECHSVLSAEGVITVECATHGTTCALTF